MNTTTRYCRSFLRRCLSAAGVLLIGASAIAQVSTLTSVNGTESGFFGGSVGGVPDLNGDGRGDLIVGAPGEGPSGQGGFFRGSVYVYSGANGALIHEVLSANQQPNGLFGDAVAGMPDVNGDGRGDLLIGAPGETFNGNVGAGRAYIFSGATGLLIVALNSPSSEVDGAFGDSVAALPDVNGDGVADVAVGAPDEDPGNSPSNCGRVYIYSGATGLLLRKLLPTWPEIDGHFGVSVSGLADVNGDLLGDLVVGGFQENPGGAPNECGRVHIYSGATGKRLLTLRSPGEEEGGKFGESVGGIPDVNGDGRGDIVVGAPDENPGLSPSGCGRAYVYSGATGKFLSKLLPIGPELDGNFGVAVAGVADLNGDGRGDVIVGAWNEDPATLPSNCGRVHIYSGATGVRLKTFGTPNPQVDGGFGIAVAGVPDSNNNGKGDVFVGAPGENDGGQPVFAGRAYFFRN